MQPIEEQINLWAEALTKRVIEIRNIDVKEMEKAISAHIKMAIHDCMKIDISDVERKLNQKKMIYATLRGQNTNHIAKEITELKFQLKERNLMKSQMEQIEKLGLMIRWMKEKHPESFVKFCEKSDNHLRTFSNIQNVQKGQ